MLRIPAWNPRDVACLSHSILHSSEPAEAGSCGCLGSGRQNLGLVTGLHGRAGPAFRYSFRKHVRINDEEM
jgi:hypothetical protein